MSTSHSHTAGRCRCEPSCYHNWVEWSRLKSFSVLKMCLICFLFSGLPLSSSGFQLPLREKCHQIHHWLPHRGRKKRFVEKFITTFHYHHFEDNIYIEIIIDIACICYNFMTLFLGVTSLPVGAGPEFSHPAVVKTALTPLASVGASFQYPPINWSAVLSPLMRLSFGKSYYIFMLLYLGACRAKAPNSASFSFYRRGCTASVCRAGSVSSSILSECFSFSGLLAVTAPCAQSQCKFLLRVSVSGPSDYFIYSRKSYTV